MRIKKQVPGIVVAALMAAAPALAQDMMQNFAGKTVTIYIGYGPGGGYDLYGRVLARHLGNHLPGHPTVVVSNMPGAASIRAANYVYNVAPKDGTALGHRRAIDRRRAARRHHRRELRRRQVQLDRALRRQYRGRLCLARRRRSRRSRTSRPPRQPSPAPARHQSIYPRLLNSVAGMKWKVVNGYNTTSVAHLAMQRREVDGATSSLNTLKTTQKDWLDQHLIRILVQFAITRSKDLADVPAVVEFGKTQEDKDVLRFYANSGAVGRAVIAPPGMPADRVALLRTAFEATLKDADFLAEIKTTKLEFEPMPGAELQALVEASSKVSSAVIDRARAARAE